MWAKGSQQIMMILLMFLKKKRIKMMTMIIKERLETGDKMAQIMSLIIPITVMMTRGNDEKKKLNVIASNIYVY